MFKRCIFMLADGAREDVFSDLMARGDLPNIQRHLVERGTVQKTLVTCFPSITGPAYIPYLMGCFPATCNVPAIRWFDRTRYREGAFPWTYARSYIGVESMFLDKDIEGDGKTVFEILDHASAIFCPIRRGIKPQYDRTNVFRHWCYALRSHWTDNWQQLDNSVARITQKILRDDFQFIYAVFPAIDEYSHFESVFGPETLQAYRELDRHVGEIVQTLKLTGRYDDTLIAISSDHGLTDTHSHFELWDFMNRQGYDTYHYPKIFKRKFNAASMVSGNAMGHLYVQHPDGWRRQTTYEDLADSLIPALLTRPEVDMIFARTESGGVYAGSRRGEAIIHKAEGGFTYRPLNGDPFGYRHYPAYSTVDGSLELTIDEEYPDALLQTTQIFRSTRTGDVVVCAANGYDLRDKYERPEHCASHGTIHRDHLRVPFYLNYPVPVDHFRTVDVLPTILDLMDIDCADFFMDGVSRVGLEIPAVAAGGK